MPTDSLKGTQVVAQPQVLVAKVSTGCWRGSEPRIRKPPPLPSASYHLRATATGPWGPERTQTLSLDPLSSQISPLQYLRHRVSVCAQTSGSLGSPGQQVQGGSRDGGVLIRGREKRGGRGGQLQVERGTELPPVGLGGNPSLRLPQTLLMLIAEFCFLESHVP